MTPPAPEPQGRTRVTRTSLGARAFRRLRLIVDRETPGSANALHPDSGQISQNDKASLGCNALEGEI